MHKWRRQLPTCFCQLPFQTAACSFTGQNPLYYMKFGFREVQYEIRLYLYISFFIETIYKLIGIGSSNGYQDQVCTPRY